MPRIRYAIAADSIHQSAGGKISILGIFEAVFANVVPTTAAFDFAACFEGEVKERGQNFGVRVWGSSPGKPKSQLVFDPIGVRFPSKTLGDVKPNYSCIFRVGLLPIDHFGAIKISIELIQQSELTEEIQVLDSASLEIPVVPLTENSVVTKADSANI